MDVEEGTVAIALDRMRLWRLALAFAAVATAAALAAPTARPGLLLPPEPATACGASTQIFLPWGDNAYYQLAPGGSFESGSYPWLLSRGARIVEGNEPFFVGGAGHTRSLYLPSGSTAYSPPACFGLGHWNLRLFAVNAGARTSTLRVSVVVMHLLGTLSILDGGTVSHTGVWQPSPKIGLLVSNLTSPLGGRSISFRFTPTGSGAAWRIDDVYVDPWKGT
jgi:hypothetical protein